MRYRWTWNLFTTDPCWRRTMRKISILDSREEMSALDTLNALGSLEMLGSQVQAIWSEAKKITFPESYAHVKNIVVAGMGGSVLGTHLIQSVFKDQLTVPVLIVPDYTLPSFVNEDTLVILSSYSGSTEETLAAAEDALLKRAKITGLTSGGPIAAFLSSHNFPALVFDPVFNPSNVPRMALGYSLFGQVALLAHIGLLNVTDEDFNSVLEVIANVHLENSANVLQENNPAKLLAFDIITRLPIITVSQHLEGAAHVFANQLNENAKTFSEYRVIPEMNHHLLEGLQFPESNPSTLLFITVHSDLYLKSNQDRLDLSEELLEKHSLEYRQYTVKGKNALSQAFELVLFGGYVSFYLSMLYNQNPLVTPQVEWLKSELKKRV